MRQASPRATPTPVKSGAVKDDPGGFRTHDLRIKSHNLELTLVPLAYAKMTCLKDLGQRSCKTIISVGLGSGRVGTQSGTKPTNEDRLTSLFCSSLCTCGYWNGGG